MRNNVHRLARRDLMPGKARLLGPGQHRIRGELGAVIADNQARLAASRKTPLRAPAPPDGRPGSPALAHRSRGGSCARPSFGTAMPAGMPLTFALDLDACAVDQQVQRALGLAIEGIHCSTFLTADRLQQTLDKPGRLPERHAGQYFHRKAGLDGGVAEALLAAPPAHRRSFRSPLGIKPDRQ